MKITKYSFSLMSVICDDDTIVEANTSNILNYIFALHINRPKEMNEKKLGTK